jgi:hypothetical protein
MASWGAFAVAEPELAAAGKKLFWQYGLGLAFIATVAADGSPRLHPITIAQTDDEIYAEADDTGHAGNAIRVGIGNKHRGAAVGDSSAR